MDEKSVKIAALNVKCANCGGDLLFDPHSQKLKCRNCASLFDINDEQIKEKNPYVEGTPNQDTHEWASQEKKVHCETCGAEFPMEGYEFTKRCPYCDSTYVTSSDQLPGIKPQAIVPFAIDKSEALAAFQKGIRRKFFVPRSFKKKLPENQMKGLYAPAFSFDNKSHTDYVGVLEKTTTVTKGKETKVIRKTFNIAGHQDLENRDYLIESGEDLNEKQAISILPFDTSRLLVYDSDYLRGFIAKHYEDDLDLCHAEAQKRIEAAIERHILAKYDYTSVISFNAKTVYSDERYIYILMPIYHFLFHYRKKDYTVVMNGQTGKVGKGLPVSPWKVLSVILAILVVFALIGIIYFFSTQNG